MLREAEDNLQERKSENDENAQRRPKRRKMELLREWGEPANHQGGEHQDNSLESLIGPDGTVPRGWKGGIQSGKEILPT